MNKTAESGIYRTFIISLGLTVLACMAATFIVISVTNRKLIYEQASAEARAHFESILITRKWNAKHGGVYVEKTPGMKSNPYLVNPDVATLDGRTLTKKNPALMTREISELSEKKGLFSFHITSLNPVNPANKPDDFEKNALKSFKKGQKEAFEEVEKNNRAYFRYMAPLRVEEECLKCHGSCEGYSLGDIRGGISVAFDIEGIKNIQKKNTFVIIALAFFSTSLILGLTAYFTIRLMKKISAARRQIEIMAVTDGLTELFNRRHLLTRFDEEFQRAKRMTGGLGCIMIDIDKFKTINDRYGHLKGDEVLRIAAVLIRKSVRPYDILGRYGGEEFLIILPDTHFDDTQKFAERIRATINENLSNEAGLSASGEISISLGITALKKTDSTIDDIIKRADDGLYKAKAAGRNRVAWI